MTMDELRSFVRESTWKVRQVHAPKTPHEYNLRRDAKDEALFERVVMHIRQVGYQQKWGKTTYTYLDLDIWQYWTMGSPLDETILINRALLRCMMSQGGIISGWPQKNYATSNQPTATSKINGRPSPEIKTDSTGRPSPLDSWWTNPTGKFTRHRGGLGSIIRGKGIIRVL